MRLALGLAPSIAAISLFFAVTAAGTARAQNAAAEALFTDGERLIKEGKIAEACDAFEGSNRLEPRAGTLVNLGLCREQNGQLAAAWSAFKDAASRAKDPKKKQIATEKVKAIEPKLSYLTISVADESRIEGLVVTRNGEPVDAALWNRAIPVDGGKYIVGGRAPGHEEWATTIEVPSEHGKVSVEVPRFKELAKLVTPGPTDPKANTSNAPDDDLLLVRPSTFTGKRKIAVGVAAVGVVAIAGGVLFGTQAKGFEDDAFALCPDPSTPCPDGDKANDLMDKGQSRAMFANVSYGVGAAALIGAGVLWFLGAPTTTESRISVVPRAGATTAGIDMTVRF
ncbi:MAG: hypothetical protein SFX73_25965 [Kofleriaceae bacterium]|nr:hypothetical protein [Kofleriaceae bacterium]